MSADRLLNNLLSSHLFEITCSVALSFLKTISCLADYSHNYEVIKSSEYRNIKFIHSFFI